MNHAAPFQVFAVRLQDVEEPLAGAPLVQEQRLVKFDGKLDLLLEPLHGRSGYTKGQDKNCEVMWQGRNYLLLHQRWTEVPIEVQATFPDSNHLCVIHNVSEGKGTLFWVVFT